MHKKQLAYALALAVGSSTSGVWAHGGEDHAAPAAPSAATTATQHVVSGETAMFSVVVKYPATKADGPLSARIYVARADTSAPVADAQVRLELKGGLTFTGDAGRTDAAGVYALSLPSAAEGATANGVVSVQAGDGFDLVLVGDLRFGALEPAVQAGMPLSRELPVGPLAAAGGALAGLSGMLGYALGRRSRRKPPDSTPHPEGPRGFSEVAS
jgi:hypothetical protein